MAPAFSSRRQIIALACLLATLLALPLILAKSSGLNRSDVYPAIPRKFGPSPWLQQKLFAETNDVDIAFLGSSYIWCAIHTPHVQEKLSEQLGRKAEVFTLGWPWSGNDALYFVARDLLDHRRVKMLVIYDEDRGTAIPHPQASRWYRVKYNSKALDGLDARARISLYGSAVLGVPRTLLSELRSDLTEDPAHTRPDFWETRFYTANFAEQLGSFRSQLGFNNKRSNFSFYTPPSTASPDDAVIYGPETRDSFRFTGRPNHPYQLHFMRRLAQLCRERGTQLVVLHPPIYQEIDQDKIPEKVAWPDVLDDSVKLVGIPGTKLFAGIPTNEVAKLFYNKTHLNQNGQDLFTPLITPTLLKIYASTHP